MSRFDHQYSVKIAKSGSFRNFAYSAFLSEFVDARRMLDNRESTLKYYRKTAILRSQVLGGPTQSADSIDGNAELTNRFNAQIGC